MTILNAVYKSSSRDSAPDNRYGYGLPNMKNAYNRLKKLQNKNLYGNEWLIINNTNFEYNISFKLIGRIDGNATINLLDADKKIIATLNLKTEMEEVYDEFIPNLDNLAAGEYSLQYSDGINTKSVKLNKQFFALANASVNLQTAVH